MKRIAPEVWATLSGHAFEDLVRDLLVEDGFLNIRWTGLGGGDRGRDLVAERDEFVGTVAVRRRLCFQCKRLKSSPSIRDLRDELIKVPGGFDYYVLAATSWVRDAHVEELAKLADERRMRLIVWQPRDLEVLLHRHQGVRLHHLGIASGPVFEVRCLLSPLGGIGEFADVALSASVRAGISAAVGFAMAEKVVVSSALVVWGLGWCDRSVATQLDSCFGYAWADTLRESAESRSLPPSGSGLRPVATGSVSLALRAALRYADSTPQKCLTADVLCDALISASGTSLKEAASALQDSVRQALDRGRAFTGRNFHIDYSDTFAAIDPCGLGKLELPVALLRDPDNPTEGFQDTGTFVAHDPSLSEQRPTPVAPDLCPTCLSGGRLELDGQCPTCGAGQAR